jgi:hypothetical protein
MLSSQLRLGLTSYLFPSDFPTNILYAFLFHPFVLNFLPISLSLIYLPNIFGEEYKSFSSSLCSFPHPPVASSLFGPNILRSMFLF